MATNVFLLLNCIGLFFLIYVLVNFWYEGHRYRNNSHSMLPMDEKDFGNRIANLPSVSLYSKDQNPVIPFPARHRQMNLASERHTQFAKTLEMRERAVSDQTVSHVSH